jgi:methionine synthase II (cobalamin-independent)
VDPLVQEELAAPRARWAPGPIMILAPDCSLKYLPRDVAAGKLPALVAAAQIHRRGSGAG